MELKLTEPRSPAIREYFGNPKLGPYRPYRLTGLQQIVAWAESPNGDTDDHCFRERETFWGHFVLHNDRSGSSLFVTPDRQIVEILDDGTIWGPRDLPDYQDDPCYAELVGALLELTEVTEISW